MITAEELEAAASEAASGTPRRKVLAACAALLLVYVALSFANDPHGYLGDTGAKVATLRAMDANGSASPDVGYWAEQWDPTGSLHPIAGTQSPGGHKWIAVTTLPAVYAALPLFRIAGYRGALLVPMAGAILAALAARALARRLGADLRTAWMAFWAVGLASPLTIYALDFWEHSLGVGLMAWGCVLLYDLAHGDRRWFVPVGAGVLFGAAATMRTEAFAYGAAATAVALATHAVRTRRVLATALAGTAVLAGLLMPLAANLALERAVIGTDLRGGRSASAVSSAGLDELAGRADEAALTSLSLQPGGASTYALGAVLLALLVLVARAEDRMARYAALAAAALYLLRFATGFGFVPGMIAATPLAAAGLARGWQPTRRRVVAAFALAPLPVVWATQYMGGMRAQWAGRYVLPTGLLLMVVGVVALPQLRKAAQVTLVGLAVAVTAFGLGWLSVRSHGVADSGRALSNRPEPVLVFRLDFLAREYGWEVNNHRWLTAVQDGELRRAADVVTAAGFDRFAVVDLDSDPAPQLAGFTPVATDHVDFLKGVPVRVTTFMKST